MSSCRLLRSESRFLYGHPDKEKRISVTDAPAEKEGQALFSGDGKQGLTLWGDDGALRGVGATVERGEIDSLHRVAAGDALDRDPALEAR